MKNFDEILLKIQQAIEAIQYSKQPQRLYDPIAYLLAMKGKKIRPALTLLACNLFQDEVKQAVNMALAWEIFHNFTLMHDDVMDNADVRRGQPTVHKKWDANTAILSGDAMLILAYKKVALSPAKNLQELLDLFSVTATEICEGQEYDMQFESRSDVREAEYLNMIRLKTAVLLGACLKSGAILGNADETDQNALYDFGIYLGIAFQIQDDILDVYGNSETFGKKIGGDILCNKKTYLLVSALNSAEETQRDELNRWLQISDQPAEKIAAVTAIYDQLLVKEKARRQMENYYQKAMLCLDKVSVDDERKNVLRALANELMNRKS